MPKHTLLQITDTHLSADADAQMQGINTSASLAQVISHARAQGVDFDAVLATGDISQDGSASPTAGFSS
jgi:Icc protein